MRKKGYDCRVEQGQAAQAGTVVWFVAWPVETKSSLSQLSEFPFFLNNRTLRFFIYLILYFEIISNYEEFQLPWEQLPDHFYLDSPTVNIWEQACISGASSPSTLWCVFPPKTRKLSHIITIQPSKSGNSWCTFMVQSTKPIQISPAVWTSVCFSVLKQDPSQGYTLHAVVISIQCLYSRTFPLSFPVFQVLAWKHPSLSFCRLSLSCVCPVSPHDQIQVLNFSSKCRNNNSQLFTVGHIREYVTCPTTGHVDVSQVSSP